VQTDTPGKLVAHAFSYEALERASYELLARLFDVSTDASLRAVAGDDLRDQLGKYLADAHAIEEQSIGLLERAQESVGDSAPAQLSASHLDETRHHAEIVEQRLDALGEDPSSLKDRLMRAGALSWASFLRAQPDTPGKLVGFAYAFEHLEIGGYEQLKRVAEPAGDEQTVAGVTESWTRSAQQRDGCGQRSAVPRKLHSKPSARPGLLRPERLVGNGLDRLVEARRDADAADLGRVLERDSLEPVVHGRARSHQDRRLQSQLAGIDRRLENTAFRRSPGEQDPLDPLTLENEREGRVVERRVARLEDETLTGTRRERSDHCAVLSLFDRAPNEPGGVAGPVALGVVDVDHRQASPSGLSQRLHEPAQTRPERLQQ
jgi:ferritin-like metal-binding protein YciE